MAFAWYLALAIFLIESVHITQFNVSAQAQTQSQSLVNLTMEHRHTLKELLLKDSPVSRQSWVQVDVGSNLGPEVLLHPLPETVGSKIPQIKQHLYFLTADAIVLVNAEDRKIVEVIKD